GRVPGPSADPRRPGRGGGRVRPVGRGPPGHGDGRADPGPAGPPHHLRAQGGRLADRPGGGGGRARPGPPDPAGRPAGRGRRGAGPPRARRGAGPAGGMGAGAGVLGKVALDVTLLAQTEVGEVTEAGGEGRGGSSTLPHKRNPVGAVLIRAATARVPGLSASLLASMAQEQERATGAWHAEWEPQVELLRL